MRAITPLNEGRVKEDQAFKLKLRRLGITRSRLRKAIRSVIDYMGCDEADDFFDADHTASIQQHIYGSIVVLEEFMRMKQWSP